MERIFEQRFGLAPYRIVADETDAEVSLACKQRVDAIIEDIRALLPIENPPDGIKTRFHQIIRHLLAPDPRERDIVLLAIAGYTTGIQGEWQPCRSDLLALRDALAGGTYHIRDIVEHTKNGSCVDTSALAGHIAKTHYGIEGTVRRAGTWNIHHFWQETREDGEPGAIIDNYYGRKTWGFVPDPADHGHRMARMGRAWKRLNMRRAKDMIRERVFRLPPKPPSA